eukprot:gene6926-7661_t
MWMRALIITRLADRIDHYPNRTTSIEGQRPSMRLTLSPSPSPSSSPSPSPSPSSSYQHPHSILFYAKINRKRQQIIPYINDIRELENKHKQAVVRYETERRQQQFVRLTIIVNIIVWAIILATLAQSDDFWYAINLICISCLCLLEAIMTLIIGFNIALRLQRDCNRIDDVSLSSSSSSSLSSPSLSRRGEQEEGEGKDVEKGGEGTNHNHNRNHRRCCCGGSGGSSSSSTASCSCCSCVKTFCHDLYGLYNVFFAEDVTRSLRLQREVLRTIIGVTFVVFFFFLIRSIAFSFYPIYNITSNEYQDMREFNLLYPWIFYQIPETLPNLAIAMGISPPNGILRRFYRYCQFNYYYCQFFIQVHLFSTSSSKSKQQQQQGNEDTLQSSSSSSSSLTIDAAATSFARAKTDRGTVMVHPINNNDNNNSNNDDDDDNSEHVRQASNSDRNHIVGVVGQGRRKGIEQQRQQQQQQVEEEEQTKRIKSERECDDDNSSEEEEEISAYVMEHPIRSQQQQEQQQEDRKSVLQDISDRSIRRIPFLRYIFPFQSSPSPSTSARPSSSLTPPLPSLSASSSFSLNYNSSSNNSGVHNWSRQTSREVWLQIQQETLEYDELLYEIQSFSSSFSQDTNGGNGNGNGSVKSVSPSPRTSWMAWGRPSSPSPSPGISTTTTINTLHTSSDNLHHQTDKEIELTVDGK